MSKLCGKQFLLVPFYLIFSVKILILAQPVLVVDPICDGSVTYTPNTSFKANLDRALAILPTTNSGYGFFNTSSGRNPDTAYAIALCRGDTDSLACGNCVNYSIANLTWACPNQKNARVYYETCMLRYSSDYILGTTRVDFPTTDPRVENATDPAGFNRDMLTLMENLTAVAASGGPLLKYAADTLTRSDTSTIYGLVQCTPDLTSQHCSNCLKDAISLIAGCCFGSIGVRITYPMCNLRYDDFRFYDDRPDIPSPPSLSPPSQQSPTGKNSTSVVRIVTTIVMATSAMLIIAVSICIFAMLRKKKMLIKSLATKMMDMSIHESLEFDFGIVSAATNDFSEENKVGQGGFGSVYKGQLENGQMIAVKRLSRDSGQGEQEFKNEVALVVKLHHRNLVSMYGFCLEGPERLLIYEFLPNGSLDTFLFDPHKRVLLGWDTSYKIIEGIARGLLYLHEDSRHRIVHRDLKASNVLLDAEMNAKIADFGMARLFSPNETQAKTSRIVGTYGYMAPEYIMLGQFSVKLDVFSFGVLVLEIITGQPNQSFQDEDGVYLLSYVWRSWRDGSVSNIIDPVLLKGPNSLPDILRSIHIALLCVQKNVADRPRMSTVLLMLNSFSLTLKVPSEPAFFIQDSVVDHVVTPFNEHDASDSNRRSKSSQVSVNDATISEMNPR